MAACLGVGEAFGPQYKYGSSYHGPSGSSGIGSSGTSSYRYRPRGSSSYYTFSRLRLANVP